MAQPEENTPSQDAPAPHGLLESLHEFWGRRHWSVKLLVLAAILAAIAAVAAKPAYLRFVEWRCDRNMALATEALRAGRYSEARTLGYSVLQFRPRDIECIRLTAEAMNHFNAPRRGDMARYLFHHSEATREDTLLAWPVITRIFPLGIVAHDWDSLDKEQQEDPAFFLPLIDRSIKEQCFSDAAKFLEPIDIEKNTTTEIEQRVLKILVSCGKPNSIPEAQTRLIDRIDRDTGDIATLLPEFDPVPLEKLDPKLGRALIGWLSRQQNPGAAESLAVTRFWIAADPKELTETIIDASIVQWRESDPVALARWLLQIDRPNLALEVLPTSLPATAPIYRLRRNALAALNRWQELIDLLVAYEIPPPYIPKLEWHCDATIAASHFGNTAFQAEQWLAAMTEARIKSADGAYIDLARMARAGGLNIEADEAMVEAIRTARGPLPLYSNLTPLIASLYRQGKAEDMLNIATTYLPLEPGTPPIYIHFSYLKTILGQADSALAHQLLTPLLEEHPNEPSILRIFALQDLISGEHANAAETLRPIVSNPESVSDDVTLITYGIALLGSGDLNGLTIAESVDWHSLMPDERTLFDQLITSTLEKLDQESETDIAAKAEATTIARKEAIAEARKRAKAMMKAIEKARPEAEKKAKAMMEAKEKARPEAKKKSKH